MDINKRNLLYLTVAVEGALALLFCLWTYFTDYRYDIYPSIEDFSNGVLCCIPLFILNFFLFGAPSNRFGFLRSFKYFRDTVVVPLAMELDFITAALVAFCAGVGEELFFRGFVQTEFGLVAASVLFSLLHFGPAVRHYLSIAFLYLLIGFYFGFVRDVYDSLWVPVVTHVVYDYVALLYIRYILSRSKVSET